MSANVTVKVWDPLLRIFHWSLALAFTVAYASGGEWLDLHVLAGYTRGVLLLFGALVVAIVAAPFIAQAGHEETWAGGRLELGGGVLGERLLLLGNRIFGDEPFILENLGNRRLHLGGRHANGDLSRPLGVADTGEHIADRIVHIVLSLTSST